MKEVKGGFNHQVLPEKPKRGRVRFGLMPLNGIGISKSNFDSQMISSNENMAVARLSGDNKKSLKEAT
ncbi:unnamed protein product [Trifolium pratense]|uniref:Uncharacterized protein n=1 Tax=Trifolium pratense TaxID=57577 RepID=A0ACB0JM29_TRIPR|nr:unnamed protein product [Trifolium pratense]